MEKLFNFEGSKWRFVPGLIPLIEKILYLPKINEVYRNRPITHLTALIDYLLECLEITLEYEADALALIPKKGAVVVVANHPFGGIEGLALAALMLKVRPDVKILANYLLSSIPPLRELFIPVNPFVGRKFDALNISGLKQAQKWVANAGMLCVFPSGVVSHWQLNQGCVTDPKWSATIAKLAQSHQAAVVPIYFNGKNSWYFHLAGMISPFLRTLLLPQQSFAKKKSTLSISIGRTIAASFLNKLDHPLKQIEYLRQRTYLLANRCSLQVKSPTPLMRSKLPIKPAISTALQRSELSSLNASACLLEQGDFAIYLAEANEIPHLVTEICRLREISFRSADEGTGQPDDSDRYDQYYLHLLVWHKSDNKIIGAYRLGLTDRILPKYGCEGMYVTKLYTVTKEFFDHIHPAIELGRSFIIPEYQKKPLPLLLLWKAILKFVAKNPQYLTIYGVVSVSRSYQKISLDLLIYFLYNNYLNKKLESFVKARSPFPIPRRLPKLIQKISDACQNLDELDEILRELEPDRKGLPILIKQYNNMNSSVLSFGQDLIFNCVDCLCLSSIPQMPHRKMSYYMGKAEFESYLKFHRHKER